RQAAMAEAGAGWAFWSGAASRGVEGQTGGDGRGGAGAGRLTRRRRLGGGRSKRAATAREGAGGGHGGGRRRGGWGVQAGGDGGSRAGVAFIVRACASGGRGPCPVCRVQCGVGAVRGGLRASASAPITCTREESPEAGPSPFAGHPE